MRAHDGRALARRWVEDQLRSGVGIDAAFLHGSIAWLPGDVELAVTSDIDILIVPKPDSTPPARSKSVVSGIALDVSVIDKGEIEPVERLLGTYHLAGSLRSPDAILAEPEGWLGSLQRTVASEFANPEWVHARCADAVRRIRQYLAGLETAATSEARLLAWLFAAGVTTHVLLVAGLRNPTVRNRYAAVQTMLDDLGYPEMYRQMLDLLDPAQTTVEQAAGFVDRLEPLFDLAMRIQRTAFHFSDDISPAGRIGAIDAARELIASGHHRDSLFWTGVTLARCISILRTDGSAAEMRTHEPLLTEFTRHLRIATVHEISGRANAVRAFIPTLQANAERIIRERIGE